MQHKHELLILLIGTCKIKIGILLIVMKRVFSLHLDRNYILWLPYGVLRKQGGH